MSKKNKDNIVEFKMARAPGAQSVSQATQDKVEALGLQILPLLAFDDPAVVQSTLLSLVTAFCIEHPELFEATCDSIQRDFLGMFFQSHPHYLEEFDEAYDVDELSDEEIEALFGTEDGYVEFVMDDDLVELLGLAEGDEYDA